MDVDQLKEIIDDVDPGGDPHIRIVHRAPNTGYRLGIFASSFNPPTIAHVELVHRASKEFALDAILALAGKTNADKLAYESSLEDRLAMLMLAFAADRNVSIGLSSHAFYVDMLDALERVTPPQSDLHFIVGFDTFERVLDPKDQYIERYHRKFDGRTEALNYLFAHSSLIVAGRAGAGLSSVMNLVECNPAVPRERVFYLDFPADLGELSATEARRRQRKAEPLTGIVPSAVENYIREHALYA